MHKLFSSVMVLVLVACDAGSDGTPVAEHEGANEITDWRLVVQLPDAQVPVRLRLGSGLESAWFENGPERVEVPEFSRAGNQWVLNFPAFNNRLTLVREGDRLHGNLVLVKRGYEQHMPVTGEPYRGFRFAANPAPGFDVGGRWEVTFTENDGTETRAIGEFEQQGAVVTGTFLTTTGDYRFLAGELDEDTLRLSTMDGAHAFVFIAVLQDDGTLRGDFWSGTRWHESWVARRNPGAALPDAYGLTYLKPGHDRVDFSFPDLDGNPVSLRDAEFDNKVVLVTLAGTWCPNCADEAEFLADYYRENAGRGLEVITLLYEHMGNFEEAARQGRAFRRKHGIEHAVLVAGSSDKTLAAETLPMLNHVLAFPTIIFIDRKGQVRRIHTGFSGPGTGEHYLRFQQDFEQIMEELLGDT